MTIDNESINESETYNHYEEIKEITPTTTSSVENNVGFWYRLVAYMIDVIIIACINGIFLSPFVFINDGVPLDIGLWTLNGLLALLVYYMYFFIMTKLFQQTIGKMIVGIKVVQYNQDILTWKDVFFREFIGRILHNVFFILKLMYLVVAFTKEKQGIHDMIGNTKVVFI
ncbi:MAG TPA: RDD family protein [Pseudogracilibacillus sp.]|nr:RDD family protein [Pseudogracilibacillus sp.]